MNDNRWIPKYAGGETRAVLSEGTDRIQIHRRVQTEAGGGVCASTLHRWQEPMKHRYLMSMWRGSLFTLSVSDHSQEPGVSYQRIN